MPLPLLLVGAAVLSAALGARLDAEAARSPPAARAPPPSANRGGPAALLEAAAAFHPALPTLLWQVPMSGPPAPPLAVPRLHRGGRGGPVRSQPTAFEDDEGAGPFRVKSRKPRLVTAVANAIDRGQTLVTMPKEWKDNILKGSLQQIWAKGTEAGKVRMFAAQYRHDPAVKFYMKQMPLSSRRARHEMENSGVLQALQEVGIATSHSFPEFFGREAADGQAYVLVEAPRTTLNDELLERFPVVKWPNFDEALSDKDKKLLQGQGLEPFDPSRPLSAPLEYSLPVLVDILRGLRDLELAGLVVGDLTADRILLTDDGRAIIGSLDETCSLGGAEQGLGCGGLADSKNVGSFACSAIMTAPEVQDGSPTGPSNHVWGAGLLFARMCMGYVPTLVPVLSATKSAYSAAALDIRPEGRERLRHFVRSRFAIEEDAFFKHYDRDVRELLEGMLAHDEEERLSTEEALEMAMAMAAARGIEVKEPRQRPALPETWGMQSTAAAGASPSGTGASGRDGSGSESNVGTRAWSDGSFGDGAIDELGAWA